MIVGILFILGSIYFSKHEENLKALRLVEIKVALMEKSDIIEVDNPSHIYIDFTCNEYPNQEFRFCDPIIDRDIATQISNNLKVGDTLLISIPEGDLDKIRKGKSVNTSVFSLISNNKNYFNASGTKEKLSKGNKLPKIGTLIMGIWCILVGSWKLQKFTVANKVNKQ